MAERPDRPEPGAKMRGQRRVGTLQRTSRRQCAPSSVRSRRSGPRRKSVPEMGFTLGGMDELMDDGGAVLPRVDGEGQVQGVTSWLRCTTDGQLVSWTLDFMRRRGDASPGSWSS